MGLKIKSIDIVNIGCIESLTIEPDVLTVIEGRNATGKSTILNALRYVVEGGHDPSLLRKGAEAGKIIIILSDGVTITATITPDKTTRVIRHPQFGRISKEKEWIRSVINSVSFEPARFLTAKPADRLEIFLESLPVRLEASQLGFVPVEFLKDADLGRHPLEVIGNKTSGLFGAAYRERTEINRVIRDKRSTASEMERNLPEESPEGNWGDVLQAANDEYQQLNAEAREIIQTLLMEKTSAIKASADEMESHIAAVRAELEKTIEKLRADADIEIERTRQGHAEVVRKAEQEHDLKYKALEADYRPKEADLKEKIGQAKAMAEQHAKAEATRELIARLNAEAAHYAEKSDQLTGVLNKLEGLKSALLADLPIKGMEIADGQLLVDGISFDRLNDAEKHRIAVEIMRLNHGDLGLMVLDRAEIFDSNSWKSFKAACKKAGLPIFATRVADSDLTVTTEGKEAVA